MVIGNGDLASVLPFRDDILFFASGVSNSAETSEKAYRQEIDLLLEQGKTRRLVYFSSLGIFDRNTRYFVHKRYMENLVKKFPRYTIIRLGNILWGTNPNTIINSMKFQVKTGKSLIIRNEFRHVVTKEEFLYWINKIPDFNCEMNIPGRMIKVADLVKEYVL